MKKTGLQIILLIIIGGLIIAYQNYTTTYTVKQGFKTWYTEFCPNKNYSTEVAPVYSYEYESEPLKIDKIYRSMEGPYNIGNINLASTTQKVKQLFTGPELYWLVGYSVEVYNADDNTKLSDEWMCHNNLNTVSKNSVPWTIETIGSNIRLFTLTEGQTKLRLPEGFGIPVLSTQKIEIVSQVLNHNDANANINIKQKIVLEYIKDSELNKPMTALYQQSAFVTKLISGPAGGYGEPDTMKTMVNEKDSVNSKHACCSIEKRDGTDFNPYADSYGREFTGHWVITPGHEVLKTNVTQMLNLKYDTKAHYVSVHVHPFCESLELVDITSSQSLFTAKMTNLKDKIGLEHIDIFESAEGLQLYKNHKYELISTYAPPQEKHTAMATMFLYIEDGN